MPRRPHLARLTAGLTAAMTAALLVACDSSVAPSSAPPSATTGGPEASGPEEPDAVDAGAANDGTTAGDENDDEQGEDGAASPAITLSFAGDTHFQGPLRGLVGRQRSTLGPLSAPLRDADLAVVKLETALASPGGQAPKELEDPDLRYWFRADPEGALDLLDRSGVDVAVMANNHAGDYGKPGLRQALDAADSSPVTVAGVGRNVRRAFEPSRFTVEGVQVGVLAADSAKRESLATTWGARRGTGVGTASARGRDTGRLLRAVRDSSETDDVTVVYMHWGTSAQRRPDDQQRRLAADLAEAGADVVVGSGSHVTQGAGMLGDTYVAYGLGDFAWYHGRRPRTGVLTVTVRDGQVVADDWAPGTIPPGGGVAERLRGAERRQAVQRWERMRSQADLAPTGEAGTSLAAARRPSDGLPAYTSSVERLPGAVRRSMTGSSHDPATCPVDLDELRLVTVGSVGFDGTAKQGRLVVHQDVAREVVEIFGEIYDARFPVRSLTLVDEFGADDNRSMAANNSSAYNCRTVAGTDRFSNHAFGRAIDINPVQNPYVTPGGVQPPRGSGYRRVDRGAGAGDRAGVVHTGGPVMTAFTSRGWTWGADFARPDYQHFAKD